MRNANIFIAIGDQTATQDLEHELTRLGHTVVGAALSENTAKIALHGLLDNESRIDFAILGDRLPNGENHGHLAAVLIQGELEAANLASPQQIAFFEPTATGEISSGFGGVNEQIPQIIRYIEEFDSASPA